MLRVRLQRVGKRNYATYRVVVAERGASIKGRRIADLGPYNPHTKELKLRKEELDKWIGQGAKPTNTVHNLLVTNGLLEAEKVKSWRPKKPRKAADAATGSEEKVAETKDKPNEKPEEKKEEKAEKTEEAKGTKEEDKENKD